MKNTKSESEHQRVFCSLTWAFCTQERFVAIVVLFWFLVWCKYSSRRRRRKLEKKKKSEPKKGEEGVGSKERKRRKEWRKEKNGTDVSIHILMLTLIPDHFQDGAGQRGRSRLVVGGGIVWRGYAFLIAICINSFAHFLVSFCYVVCHQFSLHNCRLVRNTQICHYCFWLFFFFFFINYKH